MLAALEAYAHVVVGLPLVVDQRCADPVVAHKVGRIVEKVPLLVSHHETIVVNPGGAGFSVRNTILGETPRPGRGTPGTLSKTVDRLYIELNDAPRCLWRNVGCVSIIRGLHENGSPDISVQAIPERDRGYAIWVLGTYSDMNPFPNDGNRRLVAKATEHRPQICLPPAVAKPRRPGPLWRG